MADAVRPVTPADAGALARIYNHYVRQSVITFEEQEVSADEMAQRVRTLAADALPWLVAERDGRVAGYAHAAKWKARSAYRFSMETTVYVDAERLGSGIGSALYEALFADLRGRSVNAVIGGIALPNDRSVALHERFGMKKVAHFEQVGFKFGRWIDVGYWQVSLQGR